MTGEETDRGVALVTGGAAGIGWAVCRRLSRDGYRIVLADIDAAEAGRRIAELGPENRMLAVDLTDPQAAADLPARAAAQFGRLDVIVNNAGATDNSGQALVDLPQARFDRLVALNLVAVQRICAAAPSALARQGRIVNLASGAAYRPLALRGPYSATKAAIVELTRALADEHAARGMSVVAIAPGYTLTPLVEALQRAGRVDLAAVAANITLGRIGHPDDIAGAVAFAASGAAAPLSGQTLRVDGGSFGPALQDMAPAPGHAAAGQVAVLGGLPIPGAVQVRDRDRLGRLDGLRAVVDAEALQGAPSPAETLERTWLTARACAAAENRTRDFALLFVAGLAGGTAGRVASAAQAMLGRTLALEWAASGMRVNALAWRGGGAPDRLAPICAFLTGPDAAMMTGESLQAG